MDTTKSTGSKPPSNNSSYENGQDEKIVERDRQIRPSLIELTSLNYFARKKFFMRVLGLLLLVLFLPIILLVMLAVRLTSPGPALFRQARVGKEGREFTMYKIRTMYQDAEKESGPVWCQPADARITCLGRVLRFLHLDELPQLFNVARGEMDLIGPRPERPVFVEKLVEEVPGFAERLAVLPGVTGLAQINLPPDETTDSVRRKLSLDLEYIQTASLGLDTRILLCTALRMIGIRHGRAVQWLRLNRNVRQLEKFPRYVSPPKFLLPDTGIPENPRATDSLRVVTGQKYRPGSNGASQNGSPQCAEDSTQPDISPLPTSEFAETGDASALPKNPK